MAVNKVVYNKKTLIDLTNDTVTSEVLLKGFTAHQANGTIVTGKMLEGYPARYSFYDPLQDSNGLNITDGAQSVIQSKTMYQKV